MISLLRRLLPKSFFQRGKHKQGNQRPGFIFFNLLILMVLLTACYPNNEKIPSTVEMTEDVQIETEKNNKECPQLNSQLYELSLMESPISAAEQRGFRIVDGKVFVLLVLQDEAASIPEGFDITVGTRSGAQVQALVTFSELCDLANTDEVIAIRQPLSPIMD